jgi:hypothetical protein
MMDYEHQNGLKYLWNPLACIKDDQIKISKKPQHLAWSDMAWGNWEITFENRNLN